LINPTSLQIFASYYRHDYFVSHMSTGVLHVERKILLTKALLWKLPVSSTTELTRTFIQLDIPLVPKPATLKSSKSYWKILTD
jgi:hypothetical protein